MNFIFSIIYEFCLWIIAILAIPKMLYSFFFHKKYRNSIKYRLGCQFPQIPPQSFPSIWIHAVSVGETKAVVSVARELKRQFPDNPLIISSVTETGHAEAKRSLPFADYHVYLPFDFRWIISRAIKKASPGLVILCETDFWYNFLSFSKKNGAALAVVNGKMSERSMKRFRFLSFLSSRLFKLFDIFCVQNELYQSRFIEVGVKPSKIVVTGNLKLDENYPKLSNEEVLEWKDKLGIQPQQKILTIGSTHSPEEKNLLLQLKKIWEMHPELKVILVPRHPERFGEVASILDAERIFWINFSDIKKRTGKEQVILFDVMGMLRMCYQLSDYTIVAGSFTDRVGGHNILEPCWYGKPVLFGPHVHQQLEFVDLVKKYEAGLQIDADQLPMILQKWLSDPAEPMRLGSNGLLLVNELKGTSKRTLQALEPLLSKMHP